MTVLQNVLGHFTFPTIIPEISGSSTFLSKFSVSIFNFSNSSACELLSHYDINFHLSNEVEDFLICLAAYISL